MHTLWHFDPIDMFVHWHVKTLTPLSSDTFGSDMCVCDTFVRDSFDLHPTLAYKGVGIWDSRNKISGP